MYKVLIVDDEAIIRKGLKNIIDWKSLNCEICGEGEDGASGMNLIRELKPQIILTDIRMPGMDGLQMIKETKKLIPLSKIIILTGYRDFDYMQKAIKLGTFDYILKPSKIDEILSIVKRAVKSLDEEIKKEEEFNLLKIDYERSLPKLIQKFLYDIIFNSNLKEEEINEGIIKYKLKIESFRVVLMEKPNNMSYDNGIINTFLDVFDDYLVYYLQQSSERLLFIIQNSVENLDISKNITPRITNFKDLIYKFSGFSVGISMSSIGNNLKELPEKVKEAEKSLLLNEKQVEKSSGGVVERAISYINSNFNEALTLNLVSDKLFVSSSYLSRLFAKETGKNFTDYINEVRIDKAKEYLSMDSYKAYEVADMVGINDSHYFSKLFKKYTGKTPSEFKQGS